MCIWYKTLANLSSIYQKSLNLMDICEVLTETVCAGFF